MWIKDSPLAALRAAAQGALPAGTALKRDRGEALLIADAPGVEAIPGFRCARRGRLLLLTPVPEWTLTFEAAHAAPTGELSRTLQRYAGRTPTDAAQALLVKLLKLTEGDPRTDTARWAACDRELRAQAARALRGADAGGGLYACALIDDLLDNEVIK